MSEVMAVQDLLTQGFGSVSSLETEYALRLSMQVNQLHVLKILT